MATLITALVLLALMGAAVYVIIYKKHGCGCCCGNSCSECGFKKLNKAQESKEVKDYSK